ncbi:MAG: hypothetical protein J7641_15200 [Cyanobacteria bacterium SID2]|nr:hypothetical protein [Cyanobacteria bacterium SID2]MBP0006533.1 hypothetical protein [Cyanobacteria bacterium SBC]
MMQAQALQLAKSGNPTAIAALMNHQLRLQGITVHVKRQQDCLQVVFESIETPDRAKLVRWLRLGLAHLNPSSIHQVTVWGKQASDAVPSWEEAFEFPLSVRELEALDSIESRATALIPQSVWERAKQGDSEAMSQFLGVMGWHGDLNVTAEVEGHQICVTVEADRVPEEEKIVGSIVRLLHRLDAAWLKLAIVVGRSCRESVPGWRRELALDNEAFVRMRMSISTLVNFYEKSVNPRIFNRQLNR